jgi:hypothetical protein
MFIAERPIHRHSAPNSTKRLSELYGFSRSLEAIERTDDVKDESNMWTS